MGDPVGHTAGYSAVSHLAPNFLGLALPRVANRPHFRTPMMRSIPLSLAAAALALGACRPAAAPAPSPAPARAPAGAGAPSPGPGAPATQPGGGQGGGGGGAGQDPAPRPYGQVITGRATTKNGVFKVHQLGSRLYF